MPVTLLTAVWGKTEASDPQSRLYHPLLFHLIDVGMVAGELWELSLAPVAREWILDELALGAQEAGAWIRFLAGMHDIGKCTPEFQRKSEVFSEPLKRAGLRLYQDAGKATPHALAGASILKQLLETRWQIDRSSAARWARVIGGHHGDFSGEFVRPSHMPNAYGDRAWDDLRQEMSQQLASVCCCVVVPLKKPSTPTALALAGLISVADWLASNQVFFPCRSELDTAVSTDFESYAAEARDR